MMKIMVNRTIYPMSHWTNYRKDGTIYDKGVHKGI